jgi:uncharacterized protein (DUF362 family)
MKEIAVVGTIKSGYNDVFVNLKRAISLAGPIKLASNSNVIVKINLCCARTPDTGTITHPLFLDAALRYLREYYIDLNIFVVESDATVVIADKFVDWLGIRKILDKWGTKFINLSKVRVSPRKINGRYFKEAPVPAIFDKCDFFINMPKPKTNPMSTITCCLKNIFGCLPNADKNIYHPRLDDVISDINMAIHTDLALVDGIIAMGGTQGPSFGVPIPWNTIICGKDPVAVDAYCAKSMGFNPYFISHIRKSALSGVGSSKYLLAGDKIEKIDFETNKLEMWLVKFGGSLGRRAQDQMRSDGRKVK